MNVFRLGRGGLFEDVHGRVGAVRPRLPFDPEADDRVSR
jgi:hypothetical protein